MDEVTRSAPTRGEIAAEQDAAAGGREARKVSFPDGTFATASVSLSVREDGTYRASLRFKHERFTYRRTIGEVSAEARPEALHRAWEMAKEKNLLQGR